MKRIFVFLLTFTLLSPTCVVYADTTNKNETSTKPNAPSKEEILSGSVLDDIFNDMKTSLKNGEEISISESLEKHGGLYISAQPEYDLSSSSIDWNDLDASLTNLGFSSLSASLANSQSSIDLSGKANSCTDVFNATFGDVAKNLTLEKMEIPEGFKADVMLKQCQNQITKEYQNALQSSELNDIKSQVEVKSLFEKAQAGPTQYEQKQIDDLLDAAGIDYDQRELLTRYYDTVAVNKGLPSLDELKAKLQSSGTLLNKTTLITSFLKDTKPSLRDENTWRDENESSSSNKSDLDGFIKETEKETTKETTKDPAQALVEAHERMGIGITSEDEKATAEMYAAQTESVRKYNPEHAAEAQLIEGGYALFTWISDIIAHSTGQEHD